MARGDKLLATQISTSPSSWYQRLRAIQAKTPTVAHGNVMMQQTNDPAKLAGSKAFALQVNEFINKLNVSKEKIDTAKTINNNCGIYGDDGVYNIDGNDEDNETNANYVDYTNDEQNSKTCSTYSTCNVK